MKMLRSAACRLGELNKDYLALNPVLRVLLSTAFVLLVIVGTQDLQIFPGAFLTTGPRRNQPSDLLPVGVESIKVTTDDGEELEAWRLPIPNAQLVAVIFHGNAGDVANFFVYQKFFAAMGISSYGFDYRGYGLSSGWPSESGFYSDARAMLDYIKRREGITPERLIIVGVSIGSGPASYGATLTHPRILLLFSPFVSLPRAIEASSPFGFLSPLSFYTFPVAQNVQKLADTCLIVAHGATDKIIPIEQGREVVKNHPRADKRMLLEVESAGHNDVLPRDHLKISEAIGKCLTS